MTIHKINKIKSDWKDVSIPLTEQVNIAKINTRSINKGETLINWRRQIRSDLSKRVNRFWDPTGLNRVVISLG